MPFDGYGTFLRLRSWIVDATNSVKIRADFHDDEDNNFAAGLSQCITKDGQTSITQNIPFNSRRIVSLADPIDPQDAATKDYADTKMPLDGSAPMTGDIVINNDDPTITLNGKDGFANTLYSDKNSKHRWAVVLGNATAESGSNAGSDFELVNYADDGTMLGNALFGTRATGLLTVTADPTASLGIATKQYADATAIAASADKLPLAGGTITGALTVNGELLATAGYIRFTTSGGGGYLQWNGGGTYTLGGGGTVWHTGNFTPSTAAGIVIDARLTYATQVTSDQVAEQQWVEYQGAVITGFVVHWAGGAPYVVGHKFRYLQLKTASGWYTIGFYQ